MSSLSSSATITGDQYLGGLMGYYNAVGAGAGTISSSQASGDITASSTNPGGLVGYLTSAAGSAAFVISNSKYTGGTVTAGFDGGTGTGGLIGASNGVTINTSYSTGSVTSIVNSAVAGGIVGFAQNTVIANCYTLATITGMASGFFSGGVTGLQISGSVTKTYAGGNIAIVGGNNNGFTGLSGISATNSFFDNSALGTNKAAAGDVGVTAVDHTGIATPANFTGATWSLPGTWVMPSGSCTNYGFPGPALAGVTPGC